MKCKSVCSYNFLYASIIFQENIHEQEEQKEMINVGEKQLKAFVLF